ncbi:MAG: D-glycero-beta-D-manno-heptose-7-phosphate kinase [Desulfovibrio sp.]|jgi:rfaE bifunctional protein kinase chain/domain|nr:D-glycero-beta-D-manno-heptose-7-phosphate kinase [Desulfovibrio sp.]
MPQARAKSGTGQRATAEDIRQSLLASLDVLASHRVLVIGDLMLDRYLTGDATRISPEAPIPVVLVEKEDQLIGGAGNVARNIKSLGGEVVLIGRRGGDEEGRALENRLQCEGIESCLFVQEDYPTPLKTRILARGQQMLRVDREKRTPLTPEVCRGLLRKAKEHLSRCSAIVVSDYGKGLVCAEVMGGLGGPAREKKIPLLVDPKPENFHLYKDVTALTPNLHESGACANMPVFSPREIVAAGRDIMGKCACPQLVITLGGQGMAVFASAKEVSHIPTSARQVFDVTGAGDSVIATLALGAAASLPLITSCLLANYAAGLVVGKTGAAAANPGEIREAIELLPFPDIEKWA